MNKKPNPILPIVLHLMVWIALFGLPYVLSESQNIGRLIRQSWLPSLYFAVIFYLNYGVLINKFLFNKKIISFISINAVLISAIVLFHYYVKTDLIPSTRPQTSTLPKSFFIYVDAISMFVPLVFSIALKISERWVRSESERKEIATAKLESELQNLKYQLQPHFFFNALNTIYSLVDTAPEQAKETIHTLSKLMRYLLYETNLEQVRLSKEIDFLKKYIDLMKLRSSDKTQILVEFPDQYEDIFITPLLMISLVENAFKHGTSATQASTIRIQLVVTPQYIRFTTVNPDFNKGASDKSISGIGLTNLKKRLDLLYPEQYSLTYKQVDGTYSVVLQIDKAQQK